ncbi:DUF58 domain-containing protein [Agarilytica rhodophyticola]|uniref:DUF58 domain-containing protein n=1 Tax=Agarilytica rhodophyticola TaxID=1737490 RepID=UPI000B349CBB|nr:DUF58 domain-containing protein [Agarilytica rhodophyticola]
MATMNSGIDAGVYVSVEALIDLRHMAKDLSLETNKKSVAMMDGDSRTSFRGRGMEFAEVRPYQVGDDIRNIDWRVTARTQKPYTKLFQEERERPVYILVDQRSPMFFGSRHTFKSVYAAKLATVIAWTALQNNDRIGALIFSDSEQTDSRARRGKHAALSIVHQLFEFNHRLNSPIGQSIDNSLEEMLNDIRRIAKPGSAVFLISDFHDFNRRCQEPLSILARHNDVTMLQVYDDLEKNLPANKSLSISDGTHKINIAGQSHDFSDNFAKSFEQNRFAIRKACNQSGINFASFSVAKSLGGLVQDLFSTRRKTKRGTQ